MRRVWTIGLLLACACATTSGKELVAAAEREQGVRCHRIGYVAGINHLRARTAVLDETRTLGPSQVIWLHPPSASVIKTVEGDVYRCDAPL